MYGFHKLKIQSSKIYIIVILALVLSLGAWGISYAKTGDSFASCQNRTTLKIKSIYKNGKKLGHIKVFKCTNHYFASSVNTIGSAKSTHVNVYRAPDKVSGWPATIVYSEISGKYSSVSYLIYDPKISTKQCFTAYGSVQTYKYSSAGTSYSWCS